jgi:thiamine biosynthesis protein ThiS
MKLPCSHLWRQGFKITEMEILVNGKSFTLEAELTLDRFLSWQGWPPSSVVERNGEIIQQDRRHLITLRDGDVLEIVRLVGGG